MQSEITGLKAVQLKMEHSSRKAVSSFQNDERLKSEKTSLLDRNSYFLDFLAADLAKGL